jgi:hypothetical protein
MWSKSKRLVTTQVERVQGSGERKMEAYRRFENEAVALRPE